MYIFQGNETRWIKDNKDCNTDVSAIVYAKKETKDLMFSYRNLMKRLTNCIGQKPQICLDQVLRKEFIEENCLHKRKLLSVK